MQRNGDYLRMDLPSSASADGEVLVRQAPFDSAQGKQGKNSPVPERIFDRDDECGWS